MSEIEREIEHIADNVRFLRTHANVDNSLEAHELALTALKEKLDREKNQLTCDGCEREEAKKKYMHVICMQCTRMNQTRDRYELKGEKA